MNLLPIMGLIGAKIEPAPPEEKAGLVIDFLAKQTGRSAWVEANIGLCVVSALLI